MSDKTIQDLEMQLAAVIAERDELQREIHRQRWIMALLGAQCLRLYRWLMAERERGGSDGHA